MGESLHLTFPAQTNNRRMPPTPPPHTHTQVHIEDNTLDVAEGAEPPPPPPQATIIEAFQHFACLYIKYVQIFKRLEVCYDAMVHPQKRIDVKVGEEGGGVGVGGGGRSGKNEETLQMIWRVLSTKRERHREIQRERERQRETETDRQTDRREGDKERQTGRDCAVSKFTTCTIQTVILRVFGSIQEPSWASRV